MTRPKIIYSDWGVANNFGDFIEIHKDLKNEYPEIYREVLKHEFKHSSGKKFDMNDFKIDFFERQNIKRWDLFKFMVKRPKTWIQILPFYYQPSKGFVYDTGKIIFWLLVVGLLLFEIFIFQYLKGGFN